ncbi:uncharacterized protein LOC123879609 [Maniola jurtina]|uniref:uncharacterized protein LOC123879609 n=1 Tax=Maniola jurtina TaxID=191418 RepID=UPI001E68C461|nr:uncharacterized protein LOC123879609 [Maniola jurtina]
MKSATVFLVALTVSFTVFLGTSAAAVDSTTGGSIKVNDSVQKSLIAILNVNSGLIASAKQDADNAIATAEGNDKETLGEVSAWLDDKGEVINQFKNEINSAFDSGDNENLAQVSTAITEAVAVKKAEWSKLMGKVENGELKRNLNEKVNANFANADLVDVAVKGVVCQSA